MLTGFPHPELPLQVGPMFIYKGYSIGWINMYIYRIEYWLDQCVYIKKKDVVDQCV